MSSQESPGASVDRRLPARSAGPAADHHDRFRPGCPAAALALAVDHGWAALDLGAGSGTPTRLLPVGQALQLRGPADTYSPVLTATPAAGAALRVALDALVADRPEVAIAERCRVWRAIRR